MEGTEIDKVQSFAPAILRAKFGCLEDMLIDLIQKPEDRRPIAIETLQAVLRSVKESEALLAQA